MESLSTLRLLAGLERERAAEICGVHPVTWRRWERGKRPVPRAARHIMQLYALAGALVSDQAWAGWHFQGGKLWSPEDWGFTPGEIRAIPMLHQALHMAELERRRRPAPVLEMVSGTRGSAI